MMNKGRRLEPHTCVETFSTRHFVIMSSERFVELPGRAQLANHWSCVVSELLSPALF